MTTTSTPKLTQEYRVRLPLDDSTTFTITSMDQSKIKNYIKSLVNDVQFEQHDQGILVKHGKWNAWITQYSMLDELTVRENLRKAA